MILEKLLEGLLDKTIQEATLLFVTPSGFAIMTANEEFVKPFVKAWNKKEEESLMGAYSIDLETNMVSDLHTIPLEEFNQLMHDGKITAKEDIEKDEPIAQVIPLGGQPFVIPSHKLQIDRDGKFKTQLRKIFDNNPQHDNFGLALIRLGDILMLMNEARRDFPCKDWSPEIWEKMRINNYPFYLAMKWVKEWLK